MKSLIVLPELFWIAKDARPIAEGEVGGDDDRGALVSGRADKLASPWSTDFDGGDALLGRGRDASGRWR